MKSVGKYLGTDSFPPISDGYLNDATSLTEHAVYLRVFKPSPSLASSSVEPLKLEENSDDELDSMTTWH